ncbi:MAG: hypothetical protein FWE30_05465 [Bacteroidales bacterium]|nr:hypothetical protein [Bacteroidales bacterium]MCL2738877.1 hypothetical protein [Bacteroidales bacterium]
MSEKECNELSEKILKGINLAFARLLREKQRNNYDLVISRDGQKVERVKATELLVRVQPQ